MKLGWVTSPLKSLTPQLNWGAPHFDFVEILLGSPYADPNILDHHEIQRTIAQAEKPVFVCAPRDLPLNSPNKALRKGVTEALLEALEFTEAIGGRLLIVTFAGRVATYNRESSAKAYAEVLQPVLDAARNIYVGIRNGTDNRDQLTDIRDVLQLVPQCVTALDVANAHLNVVKNLTPEYLYDRDIGTRLAHVYLSDNNGKQGLRLPPGSIGQGGIEWHKTLRALKQSFGATMALDVECSEPEYLLFARDKVLLWWNQL